MTTLELAYWRQRSALYQQRLRLNHDQSSLLAELWLVNSLHGDELDFNDDQIHLADALLRMVLAGDYEHNEDPS